MDGLATRQRSSVGMCRRADGASPAEAVPLHHFVFGDGFHGLFVDALRFLHLSLRADFAHRPYDTGSAADRVRARFVFRFFLLGHGADLVEIALEDGRVRHVFGRFGELEQNDAGANGKEAEDDVDDLCGGAVEALK